MSDVIIYSTSTCPYCVRAKALLRSKGIEPQEFNVESSPSRFAEMLARSGGRRSVPQIFIDGRHVGGFDDLAALDRKGELLPLLSAG
ncbi:MULTISPECIES: glutaredoxin 3 [unclassified Pseudomonas]|uniref:Glutaredoxin n=1 Tax=Aquipseudomonas alcaligenes TaxID=43263 RepID=A0A5C7WBN4_AQUAC|nr:MULTISPECIES: glutaredoxin 3 [unclassified Pseudomonas]MDH4557717.1 glutaredoxin 3 [Pseudomonas sp. BN417]MDS9592387.1 glutaredoxin 3 [Pseudomonas sp. HTZ1]TXI34024.1 MAG: glutaredoxin 3 [Pseudomonas alcaligenes]HBO6812408.1 glutaredoxin 3 [Pseudomonas aeruginosa]